MSDIALAVVVIGRNESPRLGAALRSVEGPEWVVYVDSGSTDASVEIARDSGIDIVQLDDARPFSAARARNEGFRWLKQRHPGLQFVQFLDGDCVLAPGWLAAAASALASDSQRAIVVGKLSELNPQASVYNRLCAMEWNSPPGDLTESGAIGGIMAVRASVFEALGGLREEVVAGEDSEFGVRVGLAGFKITRLGHAMATHDADMRNFGQWWRRTVRAGHAIGQRAALNGATAARDCIRERRSTVVWGIVFPALGLGLASSTHGFSLLVLLLAYGLLAGRIGRYRIRRGDEREDAWLYACFTVLGKLPNAIGLLAYFIARWRGRYSIIEYK